jgi:hypothetical protein
MMAAPPFSNARRDAAMLRARGQAEQYAKALPEWPPFLIVADVGHSIETYADFTRPSSATTSSASMAACSKTPRRSLSMAISLKF